MQRFIGYNWTDILMVVAYLSVAVSANIVVAMFGQAALPWTAIVLIPFELTSRDKLHESWSQQTHGRLSKVLIIRMTTLIMAGSVLTAIVNYEASAVAAASFIAFAVSGTIDTIVYQLLRRSRKAVKMNCSNIASATADSLVFPIVAFGVANVGWVLCVQQAAMKICGGAVWTAILIHGESRRQQRKKYQCGEQR